MKCCVTTRCKNEHNIFEWVDYHLAIGFDQAIIYDDLSQIPVSTVVYPHFTPQQCKVIRTDKKVQVTGRGHTVYTYILKEIKDFDYALDLDMDEYLYPGPHETIQGLIKAYQPFDLMKLHFLMYGNNNIKERTADGCLDLFTRSHNKLNITCKAMGKVSSIQGKTCSHYWDLHKTRKNIIKNIGEVNKVIPNNPEQLPVCVAHYAVQDTYNFVRRRIRRDMAGMYGCGRAYIPRTAELVDRCHNNNPNHEKPVQVLIQRFNTWNMNTICNNVVNTFYNSLRQTTFKGTENSNKMTDTTNHDITTNSVSIDEYWPQQKPNVTPFMHGWFGNGNKTVLTQKLSDPNLKIVVELGSWYGMSATHIAQNMPKDCILICVDRWDNQFIKEMWARRKQNYRKHVPFIDQHPLYNTFLVNMWEYRHKLLPIRGDTLLGLRKISELGIKPDLVYIDAGHEYQTVKNELELINSLFPTAKICGDDWNWATVQRAVREHAQKHNISVKNNQNCWYY